MSLLSVKEKLAENILQVVNSLSQQKDSPELEIYDIVLNYPQHENQGDISCPISLRLAKEWKSNPMQIAQEIAAKLQASQDVQMPEFTKIEVAAPGFINFSLNSEFLTQGLSQLGKIFTEKNQDLSHKHVVVDYSSVNIAKPLGVHHVLSTVIGQSMVNLLRFHGCKVTAWNYLGDWGTQFGKLIYAYKNWGNKEVIEADPIPELLKLYVLFHDKVEAETEPILDDLARAEFKKLEDGDTENRELWEWMVDISKSELEKTFDKLGGIQFDTWSGEADCEPYLSDLLQEGLNSGVFEKSEQGGVISNLEPEGLIPFLVQKSDGATLYSTRDVYTVKNRILNYKATDIVYVVDVAQKLHFEQLFATVFKFDWYQKTDPLPNLHHLSFGRMSFKDSSFSTRKGNILYLEDLLDEACKRSKDLILEKNPNLEDIDTVSKIIGIGAVKYSVLSQAPQTNIVFDWDKIISFEGNSAPYLQYCFARANSILTQVNLEPLSDLKNLQSFDYNNINEQESSLILQLLKFQETCYEAADQMKPNLLAKYLFDLCQSFNSFYVQFSILQAEDTATKEFRLALTQAVAGVVKTGLNLLGGIEVPNKM